jgi:isoleucyl-tRNA synthetase
MGVDVMRWMYTDQNPEHNLRFSYDRADEVRKQLLTLWNSYSFFVTYAALDHFNPGKPRIPLQDRPEIDRWLTSKTQQLVAATGSAYEHFQPDSVMQAVDDYLEVLSNWYIRRNRRRFWKSGEDADKLAAYATLYEALVTLIKVMAPVTPFVTDTIYRNLVCSFDSEAPASLHLCDFPEYQAELVDERLLGEIDTIIQVVTLGRSARNQAGIKIRQPLSEILVAGGQEVLAAVEKSRDQLLEELNIKALQTTLSELPKSILIYEMRPNLPLLGQKYGDQIPDIVKALEAMSQEERRMAKRSNAPLTLDVKGGEINLSPLEYSVEEQGRDGYAVATVRNLEVAIKTGLTEELRQEGSVRDLIRQVQNMRKEADLNVEDRIRVGITGDDHLQRSLEQFHDYFLAEVLGTKLSATLEHPVHEKVVNLNGADVQIHIAPD